MIPIGSTVRIKPTYANRSACDFHPDGRYTLTGYKNEYALISDGYWWLTIDPVYLAPDAPSPADPLARYAAEMFGQPGSEA